MSDKDEKLKKLRVSSLIELALIVPSGYDDLRLSDEAIPKTNQLVDATVESVVRAKNSFQITLFSHNFNQRLTAVLFNPKPYMLHSFAVGQRGYFYGLIEQNGFYLNMLMPKKVSSASGITPNYKTALRSDVIRRLLASILTKEALMQEGLRAEVADVLLSLHFPAKIPDIQSKEVQNALKYAELYSFMKRLSAKKSVVAFGGRVDGRYEDWAKTLPFTLTKEQIDAIEDIKRDMQSGLCARRMVVGDVGSGKTMVILASCAMALPSRSILMAPTTILANQLFSEAKKFLPTVKTALVTNKTACENLDEFEFIIGTHALLYRELPSAALVMVDEQHRFGTLQREMLKKLGGGAVHFLQFSATPIPRTLAMIQSAQVAVSLITTTPFEKNIASRVIGKADFPALLTHIKAEIEKKNQILLVYPLVQESEMMEYQSIEEARGYWERNFENVFVTHGGDKEKESKLVEFSQCGDILMATTVVEVGISLPRLSTVVIVGAERLGLATLHQLRGRVSRNGLQGYCFLYTTAKESKRLEAFVRAQNGFDIAELDLRLRKSGNLLSGEVQSGSNFRWVDLSEDAQIVKEVREVLR